MVSELDRFAALVAHQPVPLGEASLLVASVVGHPAEVDHGLRALDELAEGVEGTTLEAVVEHVFGRVGLQGDRTEYYHPDNSLLPAVLERGRGNPVSLAIVAVDVARRVGAPASVVGMPGHVLIGDGPTPERWVDGFDGGRWLDRDGARLRFAQLHGPSAAFDAAYLEATPDIAVMARVLTNLLVVFRRLGDARRSLRVLRLRAAIPVLGDQERPLLAAAYEAVGRYPEAATVWRQVQAAGGPAADTAEAHAERLRSRLN